MPNPHPKPRVLIIAEAANPEWVSVPLIGWSLSRALAAHADVHLVTQVRNRAAILRAGLVEGVDFTAIDSEAIARPLWALGQKLRMGEGKGWTALQLVNAIAQPHFEYLVWRKFRADLTAGRYDIVHRVTPLSPTIPSRLAGDCARLGIPFVLGPLNGGVPWPQGFEAERLKEREFLSYVRSAYRLLPGRKKTLRHAAAILAGSRHTASEIPDRWQNKVIHLPENAVDLARFSPIAPDTLGPLRACFIGRLVPYKGPDMLLAAAAPLLRDGRMKIDIIGDGPMMPALKEQVAREGIADAVTLHGWLDHMQVRDVAGQTSLLAFPSIREFGGGVVLEAMALGIAPLVVDYAGPGELVTDATGYKVPIGPRDAIVAGFRDMLVRLEQDRAGLAATGHRARAHVTEHFTWQVKAGQIAQVYDWVLGRSGVKPKFQFAPPIPISETDHAGPDRKDDYVPA